MNFIANNIPTTAFCNNTFISQALFDGNVSACMHAMIDGREEEILLFLRSEHPRTSSYIGQSTLGTFCADLKLYYHAQKFVNLRFVNFIFSF